MLDRILERKKQEVAASKAQVGLPELARRARRAGACRGFGKALRRRIRAGGSAVIAEIKRASPSKGLIRQDYDPAAIAASYASNGAACLSVLTDREFFQGDEGHLQAARGACELPVIRKDFMVDPYQIFESRALGADCVLLIAAALSRSQLRELAACSRELKMDFLVEVHKEAELELALELEPELVGINNRDLRTFEVDLQLTLRLLPAMPKGIVVVTESGISRRQDVELMKANGVHGFLVGESFMRAPDPGRKLRELFGDE